MRSYDTMLGWFNYPALYDEQVLRARSGAVLVEVGYWLERPLAHLGQAVRVSGKALDVYSVEHDRAPRSTATRWRLRVAPSSACCPATCWCAVPPTW
jgi:hypothetical protein